MPYKFNPFTGVLDNVNAANTSSAPADAKYIVQEANGGLSAEQSLGDLTTGLLKNTVTAAVGVLSTATAGTDYVAIESDPIVGAINGIVKANGAGTIATATAGVDYVAIESDPIVGAINGIVKANGAGVISAATDGTDYLSSTTGLLLDQTSPQTIANGVPLMTATVNSTGSSDQLVNKEYVDLAVSGLELTEFLSTTASDIGGIYFVMDSAVQATGTNTSASLTTGNDQNFRSYATLSGFPYLTVLFAGIYDIHIHMYKTGTKPVTVYYKLFQRTTGAAENLIWTSETSTALTTSSTAYTLHAILPADFDLDITDRLVLKAYANVSATGTDVTISTDVGGTNNSHVSLKVPSVELSNIFVPYTGAMNNVNLGTYTLTSSSLIGGITSTSDLTLQTTTAVGTTGADMHFLVGSNGATEAMTILNSGYIGIGTTSSDYYLEVRKESSGVLPIAVTQIGDNVFGGAILLRKARGTEASKTTISSGDAIGSIGARGFDGSVWASQSSGRFDVVATETFTTTGHGGEVRIATIPNGSIVAATRMTIANSGYVGIGTTSPSSEFHVVDPTDYCEVYLDSYDPSVAAVESTIKLRRARGTTSSPLDLQDADNVGTIHFNPYINGGFKTGAVIRGLLDGTVTTTSYPMALVFKTVKAGETTEAERMRITSAGNITLGLSTIDTGTFTMVKGAQAGDPNFSISLTADANADTTLAASAGDLILNAGGNTNQLYLEEATGMVGINSTDPAEYLHVNSGNIRIQQPSGTTGYLSISQTGIRAWQIQNIATTGELDFNVDGTTSRMSILGNNGNTTLGSSTVDCGTFTMIKGAQTGDPQFQIALSTDTAGDVTMTADTGDITLTAADDISLVATGGVVSVTGVLTCTSAALTTPVLGTPTSGTLTNCTGLPYTALANGTAGQLITWSAAGAIATTTAGSSGQVLTSNGAGAAPTFQAASGSTLSGINYIINGNMNVFQRGTSFTSATTPANSDDTYLADRWILLSDGNDIVDVTQQTDGPTGVLNSIRLDVETANKKFGIIEVIEQKNSAPLIGGTCSVSFYAKTAGSGKIDNIKCAVLSWSSTADAVTSDVVSAWEAEDTDPTLVANWTYENDPANLNPTTSWARYTIENISIDTASTTNVAVFIWSDVTDVDVGDFLYITGVQLEVGSSATQLEQRPIGAELALCQRYYEVQSRGIFHSFASTTSGTRAFRFSYKVSKRATPTMTFIDNAGTSGKITTFDSARSYTNNVAPFSDAGDSNTESYGMYVDSSTIWGIYCSWNASAEL